MKPIVSLFFVLLMTFSHSIVLGSTGEESPLCVGQGSQAGGSVVSPCDTSTEK